VNAHTPLARPIGAIETCHGVDHRLDRATRKVVAENVQTDAFVLCIEPPDGDLDALYRAGVENGCQCESRLTIALRRKTPYRDGTTHVILEPLNFIARLAALVPKPRVNLTRFHWVFAPNSTPRSA
jgi:hypothetical protein